MDDQNQPEIYDNSIDHTPVEKYDKITKQVVTTTKDDASNNPERFEDVGNQPVEMFNDRGQKVIGTASNWDTALKFGLTPKSITQQQTELNNFAEIEKNKLDVAVRQSHLESKGILATLGEKAISTFPTPVQDLLEQAHQAVNPGSSPILGQDAITQQAASQRDQQHPIVSGLGQAIGYGTQLAVGGELAGGAEALAAPAIENVLGAGSLLSKVAIGATGGAAMNAPETIASLAAGDKNAAAESLVSGIGLGGLLGLGGYGFSKALGKFGKAGESVENSIYSKLGALDENGNVSPKLAQNELNKLSIDKIANENKNGLTDLLSEYKNKISDHAEILDNALGNSSKELRQEIGVKPSMVGRNIEGDILQANPAYTTELGAGDFKKVKKGINTIIDSGDEAGNISFKKSDQLKNILQDYAEKDPRLAEVFSKYSTEHNNEMQKAYSQLGISNNLAEYQKDADFYDLLRQKTLNPQASLATIAPTADLISSISGQVGGGVLQNVARGGAAFAGHQVLPGYGAFVGSRMGGTLARPFTNLAKEAIDSAVNSGILDLSKKTLTKIAENPETSKYFGSSFVQDVNQAVNSKIGNIPQMITKAASVAIADPIKQALGSDANGLSKDQQYNKLKNALVSSQSNPDILKKEVDALGSIFGHDPELQSLVAQKQNQVINYLAQSLPKEPEKIPFQNNKNSNVNVADKKSFSDKLEVALNPYSVLEHIKKGDLNSNHIDALNNLYPSQKEQIIKKVVEMAYDNKTPSLNGGIKQSLSLLTGQNLANPTNIDYQSVYGASQAPGSGKAIKTKGAPSVQTSVQKRAFK